MEIRRSSKNLLLSILNLPFKILIISFLSISCLKGQDLHFSQFYQNPLNLNPALTGVFQEDLRFTSTFRQQWQSVPVPFTTFTGSFDTKLSIKEISSGVISAGLILNADQAGDSQLSQIQIAAAGSYAHKLNKQNMLSIGLQLGISQRAFKTDDLQFANQFNGEFFDPNQNSRERFDRTSLIYADLSTGFNWHFQTSERNWLDIGVGLFHLNEPNFSFLEENDIKLKKRWAFSGQGLFKLNEVLDISGIALYNTRRSANELVIGTGIRYYLKKEDFSLFAIQPMLSYRVGFNDAIIPGILVLYDSWRFGLSFDINVSDFKIATGGNGGPEITVQYLIKKVKPIDEIKVCPIF